MKNNRSMSLFCLLWSVFFIASYSTMNGMLSTATNEKLMISLLLNIVWVGGAIMFVILGSYYAFKK